MISTATIVVVLVAAFLLGVKFTVDLIRNRHRKVDISRGEKAWSRPVVQFRAMPDLTAVLRSLERERSSVTAQLDRVGKALVALRAAQKARWAKWRQAQKKH